MKSIRPTVNTDTAAVCPATDASNSGGSHSLGLGTPNLAAMPKEVSLLIFQFVDDEYTHGDIVALERTCRSFRNLLQDDKIWGLISTSSHGFERREFEYPPTNRERAFLRMTLHNIKRHQKNSCDNFVLKYLGEADGVRRLLILLVNSMKPPGSTNPLTPIIRGDAIQYLVEVIQCNVVFRLKKVMTLVIGKLRPGDSYPTVTAKDLRLLDELLRTPEDGKGLLNCSVANGRHDGCKRVFWQADDPTTMTVANYWTWPEHDCEGNEYLGQVERSKLVRALAYQAGIVKLSGEVFSLVSTEILHDMAVLVTSAFDMCNEERGDFMDESDDDPVSMLDCLGQADEKVAEGPSEGNQIVIIPRHIKVADEENGTNIEVSDDDIHLPMKDRLVHADSKDAGGPSEEKQLDIVPRLDDAKAKVDGDITDKWEDACGRNTNAKMMEGGLNYCANYCPTEGNKFIIIPRHIKEAAALIGMRPIMGFGCFGFEWAAEDEEFKEEEIGDVLDQYSMDTSDDSESEDSCVPL